MAARYLVTGEPREFGRVFHIAWPSYRAYLCGRLSSGWWSPLDDGLYFKFVTGLPIGYGGLVPHRLLSRFLAILFSVDRLIATIAVRSLQIAVSPVRPTIFD